VLAPLGVLTCSVGRESKLAGRASERGLPAVEEEGLAVARISQVLQAGLDKRLAAGFVEQPEHLVRGEVKRVCKRTQHVACSLTGDVGSLFLDSMCRN